MNSTRWAQMQPRAFLHGLISGANEELAPDMRAGHFRSKRIALLDARHWQALKKSKHPVWDFLPNTNQVGLLPYMNENLNKATFRAGAAETIVNRMDFHDLFFSRALFIAVKSSDVFLWTKVAERHIRGDSAIFAADGGSAFRISERGFTHG